MGGTQSRVRKKASREAIARAEITLECMESAWFGGDRSACVKLMVSPDWRIWSAFCQGSLHRVMVYQMSLARFSRQLLINMVVVRVQSNQARVKANRHLQMQLVPVRSPWSHQQLLSFTAAWMRAIGRSTGGQPVRGQPIGRVHQDNQNNDWQMVVYKPAGPLIAHRRPAFIVVVDVLAGAHALLTPSPLQMGVGAHLLVPLRWPVAPARLEAPTAAEEGRPRGSLGPRSSFAPNGTAGELRLTRASQGQFPRLPAGSTSPLTVQERMAYEAQASFLRSRGDPWFVALEARAPLQSNPWLDRLVAACTWDSAAPLCEAQASTELPPEPNRMGCLTISGWPTESMPTLSPSPVHDSGSTLLLLPHTGQSRSLNPTAHHLALHLTVDNGSLAVFDRAVQRHDWAPLHHPSHPYQQHPMQLSHHLSLLSPLHPIGPHPHLLRQPVDCFFPPPNPSVAHHCLQVHPNHTLRLPLPHPNHQVHVPKQTPPSHLSLTPISAPPPLPHSDPAPLYSPSPPASLPPATPALPLLPFCPPLLSSTPLSHDALAGPVSLPCHEKPSPHLRPPICPSPSSSMTSATLTDSTSSPPLPSAPASALLLIKVSSLPEAEEHQASDGVTSQPLLPAIGPPPGLSRLPLTPPEPVPNPHAPPLAAQKPLRVRRRAATAQAQLHAANAALPALVSPRDANEAPPGASGPLLPAIGPPPGLSRPLPTPLEPAQKPMRVCHRAASAQASAAQGSAAQPLRQLTGEDIQRNPPTMRRLAQHCATLPQDYHFMHLSSDSEEEENPAVEERDSFFDRDWNHGMFYAMYPDCAQQQRSQPSPGPAPITTSATAVVTPVPTDPVSSTAVPASTTAEPGSTTAGSKTHRHRRRHNSSRHQTQSSAPAGAVRSPVQGYPGAPDATIGAASQAVSHSAHGQNDRTASTVVIQPSAHGHAGTTHARTPTATIGAASRSGGVRKALISQDARLDPAFCQQQGWTDASYGYAVGGAQPLGPSRHQSLRSSPDAQAYEGVCNSKSAVPQHQHRRQPGGESGRLAAYRPDVRQADRSGRSCNRANEPHRAVATVANSRETASRLSC